VALEDILITAELTRRRSRAPDDASANRALVTLARDMAVNPRNLPQLLVGMAIDVCRADTAGISVLKADADGEYLAWEALSGVYAPCIRNRTPRHLSPCGTTLDRNAPQLFSYPARYFTYFAQADAPIVESLVPPACASGRPLESYVRETSRIRLRTDLDEVAFDIDTAIPCGLILNELLTDALKYAFPDGRSGNIHIRLRAEGEHVTLRVHDTGIGFPAGFDCRNTESLGLQLVGMVTEQLGGTLTLTCEGGTTFTVSIPYGRR
jgi:hypothetical protein